MKDELTTSAPVPADHPLMTSWAAYKATPEFANARMWAIDPNHTEGSLWAAFERGWNTRKEPPAGQGGGEASAAAEIIRAVLRLVLEENAHVARIRREEIDMGKHIATRDIRSSRDAADMAHAQLLSFTVADCNRALQALAAMSNWHAKIMGASNAMRPGINPAEHGLIAQHQHSDGEGS